MNLKSPLKTVINSKRCVQDIDRGYISHFIDGQYIAPDFNGKEPDQAVFFQNINPATRERLFYVPRGQQTDINRAVLAAKKAFEQGPWPKMSMQERCNILHRVSELILDNLDTLAEAETLDSGKPIQESKTGDIPRSAANFSFFAAFASTLAEECYTVSAMERHIAVREPLGVVGLITPWNLPLYLASWKIAPCLAMGNTCVLKPAEWTPWTATLLAELMNEAGVPRGVFNVVHGFGAGESGEALTRHPDVKAISFTGETGTGKAIMKAAADTLKKVSFELGGKGATVLFEDADLEQAMPHVIRAAFRNQGEICLAGSRLFVQRGVYENVCQQLKSMAEAIQVGDPTQMETQMGALVHPEHLEKVAKYLDLANDPQSNGKLLTGGKVIAEKIPGCFVEPTVVIDLAPDDRLAQEEIFGPVLAVIPFDSESELIEGVNSAVYGLSASIWSRDVNRCHRVSSSIRTGMVWVNCWFARDLRTPFGGQKDSGIGREGGRYSLDFFSEAKTIATRYYGVS
ncbi:MAG: aldehyde dehydrogenase [Cyanobacteria bacterium]|nr:aldehyde dehydrogenase [Cyanobacteriota bacterium]